jgi:hypothetical protein
MADVLVDCDWSSVSICCVSALKKPAGIAVVASGCGLTRS